MYCKDFGIYDYIISNELTLNLYAVLVYLRLHIDSLVWPSLATTIPGLP